MVHHIGNDRDLIALNAKLNSVYSVLRNHVGLLHCSPLKQEEPTMGQNYFNTLPLRLQLEELGKCRFMGREEFADGVDKLRGKKIVIVGCHGDSGQAIKCQL